MQQGLYTEYLNKIKAMVTQQPDWHLLNHPTGCLLDYVKSGIPNNYEKAIIALGTDAYTELLPYKKNGLSVLSEDDTDNLLVIVYDKHKDSFLFDACQLVVRLFSESIGISVPLRVDRITPDDIFQDSLIADDISGAGSAADEETVRLNRYRNKLLDTTRSNRLVAFKRQRKSSLSIKYPTENDLLKLLLSGKKIYIETWARLKVTQILRCSSCGKQFFRTYTNKDATLSIACPECDVKARTKKGVLIPEDPIFTTAKSPVSCKCSACKKTVSIRDSVTDDIFCSCGKPVVFPSYPIFNPEKSGVKTDSFLICSEKDTDSIKACSLINSRSKNLSRNFGIHALYLACGFLHWKTFLGIELTSPLLMCRVNLEVDKTKGLYCISLDDSDSDAVTFNRTLEYMLQHYSPSISIEAPQYNYAAKESYRQFTVKLKSKLKEFDFTSDWKFEGTSSLGIFQYQKLVLENDFKNNFDLYRSNPIVRQICLLDPAPESAAPSAAFEDFCVLDADSSQESVLKIAESGENFILQGPPGTGKSQTICNIIANAVGNGKTVLFVTEKASARNVIWNKFQGSCSDLPEDCNLTDFLWHPDAEAKSKTKNITIKGFTEDINRSFEKEYSPRPSVFDAENRKKFLFDKISSFCTSFEHIGSDGTSVNALIEKWCIYSDIPVLRCFDNSDDLQGLNTLEFESDLKQFYVFRARYGKDIKSTPLYGYEETDFTLPSVATFSATDKALAQYRDICKHLSSYYGVDFLFNHNAISEYTDIFAAFSAFPRSVACVFEDSSPKSIASAVVTLKDGILYLNNRLGQYRNIQNMEGHSYINDVTDIAALFPAFETLVGFNEKYGSFKNSFSRIFSKEYKAVRDSILACFKDKQRSDYNSVYSLLNKLCQYRSYLNAVDELKKFDYKDKKYGINSSDNLETVYENTVVELKNTADIICSFSEEKSFALLKHFCNTKTLEKERNYCKAANTELSALCAVVSSKLENSKNYFSSDVFDINSSDTEKLCTCLNNVLKHSGELTEWVIFCRFMQDVRKKPLFIKLTDTLITNGIEDYENAKAAFYKEYYRAYTEQKIIKEETSLISFSRGSFDELVKQYIDADIAYIRNGAVRLYGKLHENKAAARSNFVSHNKTQHLLNLKSGSIRSMIQTKWDIIKYVKPCFMMSPLSVCQYLSPDVNFDMVIFDEASQIFVEDSLSSVIRGKQIIISGDLQQLPPCNFFKAGEITADGEEADGEYPTGRSVLEAAAESSMHSIQLKWHYRSHDEALIHFSNQNFYDGCLVTFPSATKAPCDGIEYRYLENGIYGQGGKNTNPLEAQSTVDLIFDILSDPGYNGFSVGVVAFNAVQAETIEMLWDDSMSNPQKRAIASRYDAEHEDEPIIFCNLDTVQGDERDIMIISTTYSKNNADLFNLSILGPIRLEGGRNRLNVAVTRARHKIIVITSIQPSELRSAINQSNGEHNYGATALCDYLEYAESFVNHNIVSAKKHESNTVLSICRELDRAKIRYETNVGLSGNNRVDIGIKKRIKDTDYVLGILVDEDGLNGQSIREYARLRPQILTDSYNWKIYRIWSLSWFNDNAVEKAALLKEIRKAVK